MLNTEKERDKYGEEKMMRSCIKNTQELHEQERKKNTQELHEQERKKKKKIQRFVCKTTSHRNY